MQKYKKYLFFIFLCCIFYFYGCFWVCFGRLKIATFKAGSLQPLRAVCFCSRHKRREQIYYFAGWCLLVSLLEVVTCIPLTLCLLVRVSRVLVGSGYLHTLNLVSLVRVSLLFVCLVVRPGWKWLPAYLGVRVLGSCALCPGWKWLPAYLEPCALLVRVSLWFVLVGSGYLHALNLVSLVRVSLCPGWKWLPAYLEPCVLGSCLAGSCALWFVLVGVVTCMP